MLRAIGKLLSESLWTDWIGRIISIIAIIATITGITLREFINIQTLKDLTWSVWISIFLAIILFRVIYIAAKKLKEYDFARVSAYTPSKMVKHLREIILLHDNCVTDKQDQKYYLTELCNKLRDCMNKLTASNCCVSIKIINDDRGGSFEIGLNELIGKKVLNIARDNNHGSRDTKEYKEKDHYIRENTAYSTIIGKLDKSKQFFYRCNDVSSDNDYITSSPYEDGEIPYKSELVYAILKKYQDKYRLKGFVCIDSDKKNAFGKDTLFVDISNIVADTLFNIL